MQELSFYSCLLYVSTHSLSSQQVLPAVEMGVVRVVEVIKGADATVAEAGARALKMITHSFDGKQAEVSMCSLR